MIKILRNAEGEYVVTNGHGTQLPDPVTAVKKPIQVQARKMEVPFEVETQHGLSHGDAGDYLLMDVNGWFYPCEADVFEKTYGVIDPDWVDSEVMAMEEERHL